MICPDPPVIVMELATNGTLDEWVDRQWKKLTTMRRLYLSRQIASGMGHLHASGVVHLDLKPKNVLVFDNDQVKVRRVGCQVAVHAVLINAFLVGPGFELSCSPLLSL